MSSSNTYPPTCTPVMALAEGSRETFIRRTYTHLFGAMIAFVLLEFYYFQSGLAITITNAVLSVSWLIILGAFVVGSWLFTRIAHTATTKSSQYLALLGFVALESLIFCPMLVIANSQAPGAIQSAASLTLIGFVGLTVIAFKTGKDFSFLRSVMMWAGVVALLLIVGSVLFGFHLGTWFSIGMVALAGAAILHDTSSILRDYPEDRYVGASLQLFASVAMMFWYILRIFMGNRD